MNNPKISVIMLAYNSSKYISESIKSVINDPFKNLELLIVYDNSTDNTEEIINDFSRIDDRIKIIHNENKKGIVGAANTGLKYSKGEYIARLDSDDINLPGRFLKELEFLDKNKDFGLVGGGYRQINSEGKFLKNVWIPGAEPEKINAILFFENYFVQSSVMLRKSILNETGCYDENIVSTEDYNLWVRISEKSKVWNFSEIFIYYRVHNDSDTIKTVDIREKMLGLTYSYFFEKIGFEYSPPELHLHF
jgi:glycosyltransferase involved in cell wall biosynthesis